MFGDGRARAISFIFFSYTLDGYRRPRRVFLCAEKYQTAGCIFNEAFGQKLVGAPHKANVRD